MHHQPQIVFDERVPCGLVTGGVGLEAGEFFLGVQRRREGARVAHMEREKQYPGGDQFQQHLQHGYQPFHMV